MNYIKAVLNSKLYDQIFTNQIVYLVLNRYSRFFMKYNVFRKLYIDFDVPS